MEKILLLAHLDAQGKLPKAVSEAVTAVKSLGGEFVVGTIGKDSTAVGSVAGALSSCGAAKFLSAVGLEFEHARYASDAAAVEALIRASGATVVVAPATSRLSRVIPGVALRVGGRTATHVTKIEPDLQLTRWHYRQRIEVVFQQAKRPLLILLDAGNYEPWSGAAVTALAEGVPVTLTDAQKKTNVTGFQSPSTGEQTIKPDAKVLFVAGAGWTKKQADGQTHLPEAGELILGFIRKAGASLGSSKSLADMMVEGQSALPFMSHLNQVGQTGATPRHPKGLSTCCHGEEPHVVGWRFISERRAVNLDPNCGWARGKTDVLYVADAFEVMKKVNKLL